MYESTNPKPASNVLPMVKQKGIHKKRYISITFSTQNMLQYSLIKQTPSVVGFKLIL